jgi:tetratricopeptide (TPR) repeat protein
MEDYPRAVAAYQAGIAAAPRDAGLWFDLGICYSHARDVDHAIECLSQAAQLDPENRACLDALAVLLARAGRLDESLQCFARGHNEATACLRFGMTMRKLGRPDVSRQYLELALQKDPQMEAARVALAEVAAPPAAQVQTAGYAAPPVPQPQVPATLPPVQR